MSIQRLIIAFLITIGLSSSTTGAAYSQGRMAGGETITICSPDGTHDIILGANGEPVPTEHECHDCNFSSLDLQVAPDVSTFAQQNLTHASWKIAEAIWLAYPNSTTQARAPPFVV